MKRICWGKRLLGLLLCAVMVAGLMPGWLAESNAAVHDPTTSTQTFVFHVGSDIYDTVVLKEGESLTEPTAPTPPDGQRFAGWFEDQTGTTPFTFGTQTISGGATDIYARFESVFYITYYDVDGSTIIRQDKVASGESYTFNPDDPGFTIHQANTINGGWQVKGGTTVYENNTITVSGDLELVPVLREGHYARFHTQGGTFVSTQHVAPNETITRPAENPTKTGYAFDDWYTLASGGSKFDFSVSPTSDVDIYAHWTNAATTYKVALWLERTDIPDGQELIYDFAGAITKNGTTGGNVNFTSDDESNATFYNALRVDSLTQAGLQYVRYVYETDYNSAEIARINASGGIKSDGSTVLNIRARLKHFTCKFIDTTQNNKVIATITIKPNLSINVMAYDATHNYCNMYYGTRHLGGWQYNPENRSGIHYPGTLDTSGKSDLPDGAVVEFRISNSNVTGDYEYRREFWTQNVDAPATVRFTEDPSQFSLDHYLQFRRSSSTNGGSAPDMAGFTLDHSQTQGYSSYNSGSYTYNPLPNVLKFVYLRNSYELSYDTMGDGNTILSQTLRYEEPLSGHIPSTSQYQVDVTTWIRDGITYVFKGWYDNVGGSGNPIDISSTMTMPAHNVCLYAKWEPVTHTVTFDPAGGNFTGETSVSVVSGETVSRPADPTLSGAGFLGWTLNGRPYDFSDAVTSDIKIIANWNPQINLHVTYDAGDGSGTVTDDTLYRIHSTTIAKSGSGLTPPENKRFLCWMMDGKKYYPGDTVPIGGSDITLTAAYVTIARSTTSFTYDLNYDHYGFSMSAAQQDTVSGLAENTTLTLRLPTTAETPVGYSFGGWYANAAGTGTAYTSIIVDSGNSSPNTLYAKWDPRTDTAYTVEHYKQDLEGTGFTIVSGDTTTEYGTTGASVNLTAIQKTYSGFSYSHADPAAPTIAADGTTVVRLYYTREGNIGYTVRHYQAELDGTYPATATETEGKAGTTDATVDPSSLKKTYPGFTWDSTATTPTGTITIAGDGSLVVSLYYTRDTDTQFTVEHYEPDLDGNYPATATSSETITGTTGATVTAADYSSPSAGFSFDYADPTSAQIAGDGSTVLKLYYTRDTNTSYTVEHYQQNLNNTDYPATASETENKTGTTGATIDPSTLDKNYTGFTFHHADPASPVIAGDGNLVLKLYYARKTNSVTYSYTGTVPTGASDPADWSLTGVPYGSTVTVADEPTLTGYVFSGWTKDSNPATAGSTFTMPDSAVSITGSWSPASGIAYKVEHYLQNKDGTTYPDSATYTDNCTGTTGANVVVTSNDYTGFTYDSSVTGTKTEGDIAPDGSLVLKLYYKRNKYKVTYSYTGTEPAGAPAAPAEHEYLYDTTVTVEANPTFTGYTFNGWTKDSTPVAAGSTFTMPASAVSITGSWDNASGIAYQVEHYQQNLNGTYPTTATDTDSYTGTTGDPVNATGKTRTYTGFTYDSTVTGTVASGNILPDGSLTLKLYYTRNSNTVTYSYTGTIQPPTVPAVPTEPNRLYGDTVNVADAPSQTGYVFGGWQIDGSPAGTSFVMPDSAVSITGSWSNASGIAYYVEHYQQNLDGSYPTTAAATVAYTGTTGDPVDATGKIQTFTGFTYDPTAPDTVSSGNIAPNGNLTLKLYYTRNSNTVTYSYTGTIQPPTVPAVPTEPDHLYGDTVSVAAAPTQTGYVFGGWQIDGSPAGTSFVMPDSAVSITGSWSCATDTAYKVEHYKEELGGGYPGTATDTDSLTGSTDDPVNITSVKKSYPGFDLDSSATDPANPTILPNGSLVVKLYYQRSTSTPFVVEHYKQDLDNPATYSIVSGDTQNETGTTGAPVTPSSFENTYSGFTYSHADPASPEIAGDGSLVIKLYYTRDTDTQYTVKHFKQNTNGTYPTTATETEFKTGVTEAAVAISDIQKTYDGFTFDHADPASPSILPDGSLVIELFYKWNIAYKFTEGDGSVWFKESGVPLDFTVKGTPDDTYTYENFTGIEIDGDSVKTDDYSYKPGSVELSLKATYLEGLSVGKHPIRANFNNGFADAAFTIATKEKMTYKPGDDMEHVIGSGKDGEITVTPSGDAKDAVEALQGITIDGKTVDSADYEIVTADDGRIRIVLKTAYLDTLGVGTHVVKIIFADGEADVNLKITASTETATPASESEPTATPEPTTVPKPTSTPKPIPKTGDTANPTLWLVMIMIGIAGVTAAKCKKHN